MRKLNTYIVAANRREVNESNHARPFYSLPHINLHSFAIKLKNHLQPPVHVNRNGTYSTLIDTNIDLPVGQNLLS